MKKQRSIWTFSIGMLLSIGASAHTQEPSVVHPAPAAQMITVAVTNMRHWHGRDEEFVTAQAAGFATNTCDVVTTFDVVKTYAERQTWHSVRQRIDIVVNGTAYPAKFRELGFYPLGLNLACIDFESAIDRAASQLSALPLEQGSRGFSSLSYNDREIANSDPGTPFLNARGEVSSVLIATPDGPLEFASADDVRQFLEAASTVPAWPLLVHRPFASMGKTKSQDRGSTGNG